MSLIGIDFTLGPKREIVVVGEMENQSTRDILKVFYGRFIPNKVVILRPLCKCLGAPRKADTELELGRPQGRE